MQQETQQLTSWDDYFQVLICPNTHVWQVGLPGFSPPSSPQVCRICHIPGITLLIPASLLHHKTQGQGSIASEGV